MRKSPLAIGASVALALSLWSGGGLLAQRTRLDSETTDDRQHQTGSRQTGDGKVDALFGAGRYNDANDRSDQPEQDRSRR